MAEVVLRRRRLVIFFAHFRRVRAWKAFSLGLFFAFCLVLLIVLSIGVAERPYKDWHLAKLRKQRFRSAASLKILFVGDSFTAGELSESGLGYWAYVPEAIRRRTSLFPRVECLNIGISGSSSLEHRSQVARYLDEANIKPDYVMLITGTNNEKAYAFQR